MPDQPTIIYSAATAQQAHLLKNLLEAEGIAAMVTNDTLQAAAGGVPLGTASAPRVLVAQQDVERARQVVGEFERRTSGRHPSWQEPEPEFEDRQWHDWPRCGQCGQRRQTVCPVCQAADSDFPLADQLPDAAPQRSLRDLRAGQQPDQEPPANMLLLCHDCDEPFVPRFYRRCQQCGYDFGEGIEMPETATGDEEVLSSRAVAVLLGLLAITSGLLLYFWWLVS